MALRVWIAALTLLVASATICADDVPTDAESLSGIYVKATDTEYDYDTQSFRADGDAFVRYNDLSLKADSVTGNAGTGDFEATGNVVFTQGERTVRGQKFTYNYKTKTGHSTDASASVEKVFFHGDEMDSKPEGYSLTGSTFTTCDRPTPHYYMSARELIVRPGDRLIGRHVRLVALGRTLFTLPKYAVSLKKGQRTGTAWPSIGVSTRYGTYIAHSLDFASKPALTGKFAVRLSTEQAFQGGINLSHVAGAPVTFNLTYREAYYGGRNPDTMLSRLPEVAYRFGSPRTAYADGSDEEALYLSRAILDPTAETQPEKGLRVVAEVGIGRFKEDPSRVKATRIDVRAMARPDAISIGNTLLVPGVLARFSHYSTGEDYSALGFQIAAARRFGARSYLSLTYVTHAIAGTTPFEFDPVEIPQELGGRFVFPVSNVELELAARYDVKTGRLFDSQISITKPIHCIRPTLTWRDRFREFSLGIGLVGF